MDAIDYKILKILQKNAREQRDSFIGFCSHRENP